MKTAIIKTEFWEEDKIYNLLPEAKLFYLCVLTNPKRNGTPAFKCSDRLMSVYTGFNPIVIETCKKQLIEAELIEYIEGYYVMREQDYVKPHKGKLSLLLTEREFTELPYVIQEKLMSRSRAVQERNSISNSNSNSNSKVVVKEEKPVDIVAKRYYEVIKALQLPIRNNNNLRSRIKQLENDIGTQDAVDYLDFIEKQYCDLDDDGYKPSINEALDIYAKRLQIKTWVDKLRSNVDKIQSRIF